MALMKLVDEDDTIARRLWLQSKNYTLSEEYENELNESIEHGHGSPVHSWKLFSLRAFQPQDIPLLCDAADGGIIDAQLLVGWYFKAGWRIHANIEKAYLWYKLASIQRQNDNEYFDEASHQKAIDSFTILKDSMTKTQIARAELLFSEWKPGQCEHEFLLGATDE
jgi:TPR repeat protein